MKKVLFFTLFSFLFAATNYGQDTFSIVAIDTVTGEVGSAGASCVDLVNLNPSPEADFISELFPGRGAINTQAAYNDINQLNARSQLNLGLSATQVIDWLVQNDAQSDSSIRQYGAVSFINGQVDAAAFTGSNTLSVSGQIVGKNYAIQGNILSGLDILAQMETAFLESEGDLTCRLMAALQGANEAGADSRCMANGTSSLFAFLKVVEPDSTFLTFRVKTPFGFSSDPIDVLQQTLDSFNFGDCTSSPTQVNNHLHEKVITNYQVGANLLMIKSLERLTIRIVDMTGKLVYSGELMGETTIGTQSWPRGIYVLDWQSGQDKGRRKIMIR